MLSSARNKFFARLDVRLTTYYTLLVFCLSLVSGGFLLYRLQHGLTKQIDTLLHDEVGELKREIDVPPVDLPAACRQFDLAVNNRLFYPLYFRVFGDNGTLLYASRNIRADVAGLQREMIGKAHTVTVAGSTSPFRVNIERIDLHRSGPNSTVIVEIATSTQQAEKILAQFTEHTFLAIVVLLLLSILLGMFAARKPRSIIRSITTITRRITSRNMNERLPVPQADDEIRDLTCTINAMLDGLQHSFAEIRQFTGDASHELRNPLFALKGEMEVTLSKNRDPQEYREALQECHERIQQLIKIVNDLFLVSRFDSNSISLELSYIDLNEVTQDLYDLFLPIAQEKDIQLSFEPCRGSVVLADKSRIPRAISNLIDNAIKFTPKRGFVRLSLHSDGGAIELAVQDSGFGISDEDLPLIFKRFYQADKSRSGQHRGAGLGLQICKRIIDAHGGTISAERPTEGGMRFVVRLPLPADAPSPHAD